jgi:hypothetical protein
MLLPNNSLVRSFSSISAFCLQPCVAPFNGVHGVVKKFMVSILLWWSGGGVDGMDSGMHGRMRG